MAQEEVTPARLALCIDFRDAPAWVQKRRLAFVEGAEFQSVTEEFFNTPVKLVDRAICETDDSTLQLIPYGVLLDPNGKVFRYTRGKKGAEVRLHDAQSIGGGGHMDEMPAHGMFIEVKTELARELSEEYGLEIHPGDIRIEGLMYDALGVNRVHLAILCTIQLSYVPDLALEYGVIIEPGWHEPASLEWPKHYDRLESWSRTALAYILS